MRPQLIVARAVLGLQFLARLVLAASIQALCLKPWTQIVHNEALGPGGAYTPNNKDIVESLVNGEVATINLATPKYRSLCRGAGKLDSYVTGIASEAVERSIEGISQQARKMNISEIHVQVMIYMGGTGAGYNHTWAEVTMLAGPKLGSGEDDGLRAGLSAKIWFKCNTASQWPHEQAVSATQRCMEDVSTNGVLFTRSTWGAEGKRESFILGRGINGTFEMMYQELAYQRTGQGVNDTVGMMEESHVYRNDAEDHEERQR